ncbi:phage tail assembly chaperone [Pseudomonas agarici]|uniref:phage tail assembly chaperone n=1 Tax=Pseudomonas agarici TaxID=46677 RepID=UPI0003611964|nr:phage tail assembly chaperone [Pseudomonas agarici]
MTEINENQETPFCKLCMTPDGSYLGMFCGGDPAVDWIIAPSTPPDSRQKWDFVNEAWLPVVLTNAELLEHNSKLLSNLTGEAIAQRTALTNRVATIKSAIRLDIAEAAEVAELPVREAQLVSWEKYVIYLGRVTQQPGFPASIDWPSPPDPAPIP